MDHRSRDIPIACAGISPRRPLVFWGLIASNMIIWIAMMAIVARLFGA